MQLPNEGHHSQESGQGRLVLVRRSLSGLLPSFVPAIRTGSLQGFLRELQKMQQPKVNSEGDMLLIVREL